NGGRVGRGSSWKLCGGSINWRLEAAVTRRQDACATLLSHAKGNSRDEIFPKTMLQPFQNFAATIPHDFVEPHAAVHGDKKCSFVQAGRLGVRDEVRVDQVA